MTFPFPNFNGYSVEVWEWMSNFNPHFEIDIIIYLCHRTWTLIYMGPVTLYSDRRSGSILAQVMAWRLAIYLNQCSSDIRLRANPQEMHQRSIIKLGLKSAYLKCRSNLPEAKELIDMPGGQCIRTWHRLSISRLIACQGPFSAPCLE